MSLTTAALAVSLLVVGPLSEAVGRTRLIHFSLGSSAPAAKTSALSARSSLATTPATWLSGSTSRLAVRNTVPAASIATPTGLRMLPSVSSTTGPAPPRAARTIGSSSPGRPPRAAT